MPTQVYTTLSGFGVTMFFAYSPLKSLLREIIMNARQRCRYRRQMRYREQCKMADEIRLLRLNLLRSAKTRSTEEIIDDIWGITSRKKQKEDRVNTLANFIAILKNELYQNEPTDSITNRCLPNTYLLR
uniref:Uncharacterized protein n=3 Tax=Arsenophonus nasoniae TaxID=638 RepID=D2U4K3_9GAMM|nr:hypothetical protein ARN_36250 [Arsenophonus nasoniae]